MFKEKMKGFIAGVCAAVLVTGTVSVLATGIDVYIGGVRIYWEGVEKTLFDVKGNKVEPMIYNGTTYVPLRGMAELMGKNVDWDQANMSVYVGGAPTEETTPLDKLDKSKIDTSSVGMQINTSFKLKDKDMRCDNLLLSDYRNNIYILDGKYTRLVAKAVMPYTKIGSDRANDIVFYSVEDDGSKNELARYELEQTKEPIDIEVNLRGVTNMEIDWYVDGVTGKSYDDIALYNINLLAQK